MNQQCRGQVWKRGAFRPSLCTRPAQEGKQYCKQHDPEIMEKKRLAEKAQWEAEWKLKDELRKLFSTPVPSVGLNGSEVTLTFRLSESEARRIAALLRGEQP